MFSLAPALLMSVSGHLRQMSPAWSSFAQRKFNFGPDDTVQDLQNNLNDTSESGGVECVHDSAAALRTAREGKACEWLFHITHHGGSAIVNLANRNGLGVADATGCDRAASAYEHSFNQYLKERWLEGPLQEFVPCNRSDFVSIIIVRDPLSRLMAGDGMWTTTPENNFSNIEKCHSDNYGLRKLIGKRSPQPLDWADVNFAKRRLRSFDMIIDLDHIEDHSKLLCGELGWSICSVRQRVHKDPVKVMPAELYADLRRKNRFELAFHAYAQDLAAERFRASVAAGRTKTGGPPSQQVAVPDVPEPMSKWVCSECVEHSGGVPKWVC